MKKGFLLLALLSMTTLRCGSVLDGLQVYSLKGMSKQEIIDEQLLKPQGVGRLYEVMQHIDTLFRKHNIHYWLDGGSLLGAVRHGGLMPWDNDIDLKIFVSDAPKVEKLEKEFKKIGLEMRGFRQGKEHIQRFTLWGEDKLHLDIFFTRVVDIDGKVELSTPEHQNLFKKSYYFINEVVPTKRMKFGPCEVEVPNDPYRYLETFYGEHYDKMLVLKTPSPNFRKRFPRKYGFLLAEKPQCYYTLGDPSIKLPFVKDDPYYMGQHKHPVVQKSPKKKPAAAQPKKKSEPQKKIIKGKKPTKKKPAKKPTKGKQPQKKKAAKGKKPTKKKPVRKSPAKKASSREARRRR